MAGVIRGGCLCGAVRYEIDAPFADAVYCHCSQCRRASGSAFAANAGVAKAHFKLVAGQAALRAYESSPRKLRWFCSRCGSPVYNLTPHQPNAVRVRLGTVDGDPGIRPDCHIFVGSKAPWDEIRDALPQHDTVPNALLKEG